MAVVDSGYIALELLVVNMNINNKLQDSSFWR